MAGIVKSLSVAEAIDGAISSWCEVPFNWGSSDCILSIADIVQVRFGYDPAAPYRGRYRTMRGALRVTKPDGGFAGAVIGAALRHGWLAIPASEARDGDVGLVRCEKGLRIGVIKRGPRWLCRIEGCGFHALETKDVERAWRVR